LLALSLAGCQDFADMRGKLDGFPVPKHLELESEHERGSRPVFAGGPHAVVERIYRTDRDWKSVCDELIAVTEDFSRPEYINWRGDGCSFAADTGTGLGAKLQGVWSYRLSVWIAARPEGGTRARIGVADLG
jgi:hypothetical protein